MGLTCSSGLVATDVHGRHTKRSHAASERKTSPRSPSCLIAVFFFRGATAMELPDDRSTPSEVARSREITFGWTYQADLGSLRRLRDDRCLPREVLSRLRRGMTTHAC